MLPTLSNFQDGGVGGIDPHPEPEAVKIKVTLVPRVWLGLMAEYWGFLPPRVAGWVGAFSFARCCGSASQLVIARGVLELTGCCWSAPHLVIALTVLEAGVFVSVHLFP